MKPNRPFLLTLSSALLVAVCTLSASTAMAQSSGRYHRTKITTTRLKTIVLKQTGFLTDAKDSVKVRGTLTYSKYQVQVTPRINPSLSNPEIIAAIGGCAEIRVKAFNLTLKSPILKIKGGDSQNCVNSPETYVFDFGPAMKKPNRLKTVDDSIVFNPRTDSDCKAYYRGELSSGDPTRICPMAPLNSEEGLAIDVETLVEVPLDYALAIESE